MSERAPREIDLYFYSEGRVPPSPQQKDPEALVVEWTQIEPQSPHTELLRVDYSEAALYGRVPLNSEMNK